MSHRNDDGGQFSTPHSRSTEVVPATANRDGIIYFSNHPGASIAIASAAAGAAINTVGLATEHEQFDDEKWNDGGSPASRSLGGWWLGMFFIFLVNVFWATSSVLVQRIADDMDYDQPVVITYIGACLLSCFIPIHVILVLLGWTRNPSLLDQDHRVLPGEAVYTELESNGISTFSASPRGADRGASTGDRRGAGNAVSIMTVAVSPDGGAANSTRATNVVSMPSPLRSHWFHMKLGFLMAPIWFFAQWTYVASLARTSVTSNTIICNSSSLFTFTFNVLCRTERYTPLKAMGVAVALSGAMAVGLGDRGGEEHFWGDVGALSSAIAYGVYSTVLKKMAPSDDEVLMYLILGYMGVGNVILILPVLVYISLAPGILALQGLTLTVLKLVMLRALCDNVLSELVWARAILLTTPTIATVGCSLTIPIAFVTDFVLHQEQPNLLAVLGAFLVVGGFLLVSGGESHQTPRDSSAAGTTSTPTAAAAAAATVATATVAVQGDGNVENDGAALVPEVGMAKTVGERRKGHQHISDDP